MQDNEFIEPEQSEFLETFGADRVAISGDVASFLVKIDADPDNTIELTYDVIARSVRVRWLHNAAVVADLYKERVDRLSVDKHGSIEIASRGTDLASKLTIEVYPIRISEVQLAF
ncbi:hypothetical protein [Nocardia xishanensis]|uniref:hypothetical protein n=1 Tax=Nocardia xishanensis TaxID=238964 RepID=UPI00082E8E05|nr:hypothetical protein [Nocardia xishanensis]